MFSLEEVNVPKLRQEVACEQSKRQTVKDFVKRDLVLGGQKGATHNSTCKVFSILYSIVHKKLS